MTEPDQRKNDKAEDAVKRKPKKPVEYRRFEKLLKQVIKAPPLRREKINT